MLSKKAFGIFEKLIRAARGLPNDRYARFGKMVSKYPVLAGLLPTVGSPAAHYYNAGTFPAVLDAGSQIGVRVGGLAALDKSLVRRGISSATTTPAKSILRGGVAGHLVSSMPARASGIYSAYRAAKPAQENLLGSIETALAAGARGSFANQGMQHFKQRADQAGGYFTS